MDVRARLAGTPGGREAIGGRRSECESPGNPEARKWGRKSLEKLNSHGPEMAPPPGPCTDSSRGAHCLRRRLGCSLAAETFIWDREARRCVDAYERTLATMKHPASSEAG